MQPETERHLKNALHPKTITLLNIGRNAIFGQNGCTKIESAARKKPTKTSN